MLDIFVRGSTYVKVHGVVEASPGANLARVVFLKNEKGEISGPWREDRFILEGTHRQLELF